jgi:hypothetical protein
VELSKKIGSLACNRDYCDEQRYISTVCLEEIRTKWFMVPAATSIA